MKSRKTFYALTFALTLAAVAALTGAAESLMRKSGIVANYCERTGYTCPMFFEWPLEAPWQFIRTPNSSYPFTTSEFKNDLIGNSEGLTGERIPIPKAPKEFRVIVLGDSFTEGIGASKDHGYVDVLRQYFQKLGGGRSYTVLNAGIAGSDPIFYLALLKHKLAVYKPDLVLMAMNASDIADIKRRGGYERFDDAGALKPLPRPRMAWLFEHSHLVRAFFLKVLHYNWDLRSPAVDHARTEMAVHTLIESGTELHELAQKMNFRYFVMFHPYSPEVKERRLARELELVEQGLRQNRVSVLNLTNGFAQKMPLEKLDNYFWPKDEHCNDNGYRVFADVLWSELKSANALPSVRNL